MNVTAIEWLCHSWKPSVGEKRLLLSTPTLLPIKITVNVEGKANLQPSSEREEIDSRFLKGYRPAKKDKDEANWEH